MNKNKTNELSSLEVLNVEHRVKQVRLNYAHKIFNNAGPSYLKNHFIKIIEHHKHNIRSIVLAKIKRIKSTFYYNAIQDCNNVIRSNSPFVYKCLRKMLNVT